MHSDIVMYSYDNHADMEENEHCDENENSKNVHSNTKSRMYFDLRPG